MQLVLTFVKEAAVPADRRSAVVEWQRALKEQASSGFQELSDGFLSQPKMLIAIPV
jgi:hypothetical protein